MQLLPPAGVTRVPMGASSQEAEPVKTPISGCSRSLRNSLARAKVVSAFKEARA